MAKKSGGVKSNKFAFYSLIVLGAYYFAIMIISAVDIYGYFEELMWMGMAGGLALLAFLARFSWNYVARKLAIYKVLYFFLIAIVAVGIILPPCMLYA